LTPVTSPNSAKTRAISSSLAFQEIFPTKMVLLGGCPEAASSDSLFAAEMVSLGVSAGAAREAFSLRATSDVVNDRDAESDTFLGTAVLNATRELMLLVA
jgi:hypothetical protein